MGEPVIISGLRTPIGQAKKGSLINFRPDDLAAVVMKGVYESCAKVNREEIDDIIMGCAMPEAEQGLNVANIAKFIAGLPSTVPAMTVNRFCSSGLQTLAIANDSIIAGRNSLVIAGGTESMSLVPMGGNKFSPNPELLDKYPESYMNMGNTAERVAEKYSISRQEQDTFAYESHMKALEAQEQKRFDEEIIPLTYENHYVNKQNKLVSAKITIDSDEGPRKDTSLESLAKLRPVFKVKGTVTAGNSSQMSDGAAALLLMSKEKAKELKVTPMARLVTYAVAGVPPEIMGIGPLAAIPKALKLAKLKLKDIGLIELNEAFASQSLAVMKELQLDQSRVNVKGGAIALGHPLGATGAVLTVKLLYEMKYRNIKYGIVSMCIGGGMGAAGIFENLLLK